MRNVRSLSLSHNVQVILTAYNVAYACGFPGCTRTFGVRSNAKRHLRTHGVNPAHTVAISKGGDDEGYVIGYGGAGGFGAATGAFGNTTTAGAGFGSTAGVGVGVVGGGFDDTRVFGDVGRGSFSMDMDMDTRSFSVDGRETQGGDEMLRNLERASASSVGLGAFAAAVASAAHTNTSGGSGGVGGDEASSGDNLGMGMGGGVGLGIRGDEGVVSQAQGQAQGGMSARRGSAYKIRWMPPSLTSRTNVDELREVRDELEEMEDAEGFGDDANGAGLGLGLGLGVKAREVAMSYGLSTEGDGVEDEGVARRRGMVMDADGVDR